MAKLLYGAGVLSAEGKNIAGIEINFKGVIEYTVVADLNSTMVKARKNKIVIINLAGKDISGDIIYYKGEFRVTKVIVSDWNAQAIPCTISTSGVSLPSQIESTSESMTTNVEDMKYGYTVGKKPRKTRRILRKKFLNMIKKG